MTTNDDDQAYEPTVPEQRNAGHQDPRQDPAQEEVSSFLPWALRPRNSGAEGLVAAPSPTPLQPRHRIRVVPLHHHLEVQVGPGGQAR